MPENEALPGMPAYTVSRLFKLPGLIAQQDDPGAWLSVLEDLLEPSYARSGIEVRNPADLRELILLGKTTRKIQQGIKMGGEVG
jgi:hypothetical protein